MRGNANDKRAMFTNFKSNSLTEKNVMLLKGYDFFKESVQLDFLTISCSHEVAVTDFFDLETFWFQHFNRYSSSSC